MPQRFRITTNEIKLYYRYACRFLGLSAYQVHQICLSKQRLIYVPIPKNACTTVKQALHQIEFGRVFDRGRPENATYLDIHDYYTKQANAFTGISNLQAATDHTRFALIRDPVERLISCYRNRVVDLGDLEQDEAALAMMGLPVGPDVNSFVMNLDKYQKVSKSIEHHTRPQSAFLGGTLRYLDSVFPIEDLDGLQQFLKQFSPGLTFLKRKSGGTKVEISDLSQKALKSAQKFYKKDYQLLKEFYTPRYR